MAAPDLRIGIHLGATHTDVVLLDRRDRLLAKEKLPADPDLARAVRGAVRAVASAPGVDRTRITRAILGPARALDAVLARRRLRRIAILRVGGPLTHAAPPLLGWPKRLREAVSAGEAIVPGGADFDGGVATALDADAVRRFLGGVGAAEGVAITGVFSPVNPGQELEAAELVREELGPVPVSLSHEIGSVGLLERENATVLNAVLVGEAERLAAISVDALAAEGVDADIFFAQNDGAVMALDYAVRFPVLMLAGDAGTGFRGAAYLSGVGEGVVIDVGGGASTIGALINGAPRESGTSQVIEGVETNFRMPDVWRVPFGGGSVVAVDADPPVIRPEVTDVRDALVFGGTRPTLTDVAVAAGRARVGTQALSPAQQRDLARVQPLLDARLAGAVERAQGVLTAPAVVAVGGGGPIVPDGLGGAEVIRPANGEVANAVACAVAPVTAQADRVCATRTRARRQASEEACRIALARAIHAGADPAGVQVVDVEEVPLSYMLDPGIRVRATAVGPRG
jgi:N-methylhydantoinase A/oxoprolinase/acetone carboxylase beta subunit